MSLHVAVRGFLAALAVAVVAGGAEAEEAPIRRGLGERVADFTLPDARTGEPVSLHQLRGREAGVLVFLGVDCPIGNQYMARLAELARRYEDRGVVFLGINSDRGPTADRVAAYADRELRRYNDLYRTAPRTGRLEVIVGSDFHSWFVDPFALRVFLDTIEMVQPDIVVLNGDPVQSVRHFANVKCTVRAGQLLFSR